MKRFHNRIFKLSTITPLLLLGIACTSLSKNIAGDYTAYTANGRVDLTLEKDGKFSYTFGRDSFCNGKIRGTYVVVGRKLKFKNDYEHTDAYLQHLVDSLNAITTDEDSVAYDVASTDFDMGLVDWKIQKQSVQPIREIETPCIRISEKHVKINAK